MKEGVTGQVQLVKITVDRPAKGSHNFARQMLGLAEVPQVGGGGWVVVRVREFGRARGVCGGPTCMACRGVKQVPQVRGMGGGRGMQHGALGWGAGMSGEGGSGLEDAGVRRGPPGCGLTHAFIYRSPHRGARTHRNHSLRITLMAIPPWLMPHPPRRSSQIAAPRSNPQITRSSAVAANQTWQQLPAGFPAGV